MPDKKQTILKFELEVPLGPFGVFERFYPKGQMVLNSQEWYGKEPRSCAVTNLRSAPRSMDSEAATIFYIEVTYKPKGVISYTGETRYDGWTAMLLDRMKDGTLLDGHGKPLAPNSPPVYLPYEMYHDTDFNEIEFGKFLGEFDVNNIEKITYDEVMNQIASSGSFDMSISTTFTAPRKSRPPVKIILTNTSSGVAADKWGTRIINVDFATPHLAQVIVEHVQDIVRGTLEGKYSIKSVGSRDSVFLELSDLLVDCTPNESDQPSRFDCLLEFVPKTFLDDLAQWVRANYQVDVKLVEGKDFGLFLTKSDNKRLL